MSVPLCSWSCIVGNLKKWKDGAVQIPFQFEGGDYMLQAYIAERGTREHIVRFVWDAPRLLYEMKQALVKVSKAGIKLIDFKLEFGRDAQGRIMVCDEISPDTSRLWDAETDRKLDKDRFRHDLSYVVASYEEVLERVMNVNLD